MTPCIEWTKYVAPNGYGMKTVSVGGQRKVWLAHRWVWTQVHGEIPPGLCVCHTCDNRKCVNVEHMWLGTKADNNADRDSKGRHVGNGQKKWTHCKAGHEFTPENTYIHRTSGQRVCRKCNAEAVRRSKARKADTT